MTRLIANGIAITSVRLNGGAASHILSASKIEDRAFNDLDVVFMLAEEPNLSVYYNQWEKIRATLMMLIREYVMGSVHDSVARSQLADCPLPHLEHIYVQKLVMVPNPRSQSELAPGDDCWSLMCFRNEEGKNVEFKFVNRLKRCYEFPTDSFQIILNEAVLGARDTPGAMESEEGESSDKTTYAVTQYLSCHHDLDEALKDLREKRVAVYKPEQIRGGGFLRYIQLCLKGYLVPNSDNTELVEKNQKLMLTRFLLDFRDRVAMARALENYMRCHYPQCNQRNMDDGIKFLNKIEMTVEKSPVHRINKENGSFDTTELIQAVREHRDEIRRYISQLKETEFDRINHKWRTENPGAYGQGERRKRKYKGKHRRRFQPRNRNGQNWNNYPHRQTHMRYNSGRDDTSQVRGLRPHHLALAMG